MAKFLNYVDKDSEQTVDVIGDMFNYKDMESKTNPATLFMVKDLEQEQIDYFEDEIPSAAIVENQFWNYSIVVVPDNYTAEVYTVLNYCKKRWASFSSYQEYSDFVFTLDRLL